MLVLVERMVFEADIIARERGDGSYIFFSVIFSKLEISSVGVILNQLKYFTNLNRGSSNFVLFSFLAVRFLRKCSIDILVA